MATASNSKESAILQHWQKHTSETQLNGFNDVMARTLTPFTRLLNLPVSVGVNTFYETRINLEEHSSNVLFPKSTGISKLNDQ